MTQTNKKKKKLRKERTRPAYKIVPTIRTQLTSRIVLQAAHDAPLTDSSRLRLRSQLDVKDLLENVAPRMRMYKERSCGF